MIRLEYDADQDVLTVILLRSEFDRAFETDNFTACLDEQDRLVRVAIADASTFVRQALDEGVLDEAEGDADGDVTWESVESSMIRAFGYDPATRVLEVAFNRTGVYRYYDVPPEEVEGLRRADSKGSYMRSYIIDQYAWDKL